MNLEQEAYFKVFKAFACRNKSDWKQQQLLKNVREELGISGQLHDEIFDKVMSDLEVQEISDATKIQQPAPLDTLPIRASQVSQATPKGAMNVIPGHLDSSLSRMTTTPIMQKPKHPPDLMAHHHQTPHLFPNRVASSVHPSIVRSNHPGGYSVSSPTNYSLHRQKPELSVKRPIGHVQSASGLPRNKFDVAPLDKAHPLIGHKIKRYWPYNPETGDLEGWYVGILAEFNKEKNEFCIVYDYGDHEKESQEWFNLNTSNPNEYEVLDEVFVPGQEQQKNEVLHTTRDVGRKVKQLKLDPEADVGSKTSQLTEFSKKICRMEQAELLQEEQNLVEEQLKVREEIELLKYSLKVAEMVDVKDISAKISRLQKESEHFRQQIVELTK